MKSNNKQGFDSRAISRRIVLSWMQTIAGILLLAALTSGSLFLLGFHWSFPLVILGLWVILPLLGWYHSGTLVRRLMRCQEPDPLDPEHARLIRIVDDLLPKTGLKVRPPVLVSPLPVPNAFATGRSPSKAFIAATEGLFQVGLTDDELESILAHELAHVKSNDVAITSLTSVLGSAFSIVLAQGIPGLFNAVFNPHEDSPLLDKLERKVKRDKKKFFATTGGIAGLLLMVAVFFIVNVFSKLVTMFVSRSRESHADALAALWTGKPCALSSALQKIVLWMTFNGMEIRMKLILQGLSPVLFAGGLEEDPDEEPAGLMGKLRRWWQQLGENHPPIPKRLEALDRMSGGSCPRLI